MRKFDDWLMDELFQPWADDFQRWTGRTCYFLAGMAASVCFVIIAGFIYWNYVLDGSPRPGMLFSLFAAYLFARDAIKAFRLESTFQRSANLLTEQPALNPKRQKEWWLRILLFPILLALATSIAGKIFFEDGGLRGLLNFVAIMFIQAELYFRACTPKIPPPKREAMFVPAYSAD